MTAAHVTGARNPRHRRPRHGHHRLLWLPLVVFAAVASMAFIYVVYVPVSYTHLTLPTNREV